MAKKEVERFLIAGGETPAMRLKYDCIKTMEDFISTAAEDGYEFNMDELKLVLQESGDSFESFGNPPKRMIWWF